MIIDCHNHVLATALPPGHDLFVREMRAPGHRRAGRLPAYRATTDDDWAGLEGDLAPIDPLTLIDDHVSAGVDRATVLAVAPSTYTAYGERGTIDLGRMTDVDGPLEVAKSNDYIAALSRRHPGGRRPRPTGPEALPDVRPLRARRPRPGIPGLRTGA
jgi:hypothetical protein